MKTHLSAIRLNHWGNASHQSEVRSPQEHTIATKRVANVSLPCRRSAEKVNAPQRVDDVIPGHALRHCKSRRTLMLPNATALADRPHACRLPRSTTGRLAVARIAEGTTMNDHETAKTDPRPAPADPLLTPEDVSTMLGGVPAATLKRWRTQRTGPVPMHIGRHVRYRRSAVEAWLAVKDREAADWMVS